MAKKRKSDNAGLDEVERTLYTSFCTAANSISQLYTQAQHQQKVAFQAGERHCVEKLYNWLHREHQAGSNISSAEILNYLQNELDGEEMTVSPGMQFQQLPLMSQQQQPQQHQQQLHSPNNQVPPGAVGYSSLGNPGRMGGVIDQTKLSIFTGALSSPNRRSLPSLPVVHGGYGSVNHVSLVGNVGRRSSGGADQPEAAHEEQESPTSNQTHPYNTLSLPSQTHGYGYIPPHGQHRESHTFGENDSSMDMHADGGSEDYYHHSN
ncbi:unnamed protein product [Calypogeia fissa]